jgi:hypothetical protein
MVELTKGDWARLGALAAWGVWWTPFWDAAVDELIKHPWDAMGAVATATAAMVALWLGKADMQRRKVEELRARRIYRWVFGSEIATLEAVLIELDLFLKAFCALADGDELDDSIPPWLDTLAENVELPAIHANLDQLAYFPDNVGQPVSALAGHISGLKKGLKLFNRTPEINAKQKSYAASMHTRVQRMLELVAAIDWKAAR